jgi:dihydroxy-acid dehydratase
VLDRISLSEVDSPILDRSQNSRPAQLRSARWFSGIDMNGFIHRAWLNPNGFSREALRGRPVVGICNTWSELVGCNVHLRGLAEAVKRGVLQAGGLPLEFPVMSLGENVMKPNAMMFRNLVSMDVEESIRANPIDAVVLLASCDKTTPAVLMGAASADLPAILVTGGPQVSGWHGGADLGSGAEFALGDMVRAGELSIEEFYEIEEGICRSHGHCMDMGSASTIACCAEALGMTLPGCATIPAVDSRRAVLAERSGRRAVELAHESVRPSGIMTREAFENALRVLQAIGGSTNAVMHLIALAGRVGLGVGLDDVAAAGDAPLLLNVRPSGEYLMEDVFKAGGMPALLGELLPLLHGEAVTVTGRTLAENVGDRRSERPEVIRRLDDPVAPGPAIAVVRGSLAPEGAVVKRSAASPGLLAHRGSAAVFEDILDLGARIDDPALPVTPDSVLVLKNGGPKGAPGMPEWGHIPLPRRLLERGVRDAVRISDSRMSGTSSGTVVLHVSPEAALPGPLAALRSGDVVSLDVDAGRLDLEVGEREIARRLERFERPAPPYRRGYGALYVDRVLQAHEGADFDFLRNESGERPDLVPLGLMEGWVGH